MMSLKDTSTTIAARVSWLELSDDEEETTSSYTLMIPSSPPLPAPRIAPNAFIEETIFNDGPDSPVSVELQSRRCKENGQMKDSMRSELDCRNHLDRNRRFLCSQVDMSSIKLTHATSYVTSTMNTQISVPANGFIEETISNDGPDSDTENDKPQGGRDKSQRRQKGKGNQDLGSPANAIYQIAPAGSSFGSVQGPSVISCFAPKAPIRLHTATKNLSSDSVISNTSTMNAQISVPANGFIEETISNDGPDSDIENDKPQGGRDKSRRRQKGRGNQKFGPISC